MRFSAREFSYLLKGVKGRTNCARLTQFDTAWALRIAIFGDFFISKGSVDVVKPSIQAIFEECASMTHEAEVSMNFIKVPNWLSLVTL